MVLLSISFENMHQILRNLYDTMTKLCHPMMDMAMALAALGALFYIAYRVWQSLSRAEPIDVFSMLRPFVLGMCILFFDVMVLGTLNGIFSPIVQGTGMLLRDQTFDLQKYQQEKDKLRADMMAKTMMTGRVFAYNEELDAELDNMGWSEEEHTALQTMYEVSYAFSLQGIVQMVMRKLLEILFQSASLVIDTIRTFFLIVLSILGPIAFALSVFDGLQNTLIQWLARYNQCLSLAAGIRPIRGDACQDTDAHPAGRDEPDGRSDEYHRRRRFLGHLSDIHGHRHYRIFLCADCFELDCPGGRYEFL